MKEARLYLLATASVCGALLLPGAASAQDSSKQNASTDENAIIVTARRTDERLQDVPISITVYNQAQLDNRNITNAGDLGAYTPSLSTNGRFGAENTSFAIRGFTQEVQAAPSVAIYFAEVGSPRSQGGITGGNGAGPGSFFDLQNVQVLKGPQGTLFGRNTDGGAVLLVPNKPTNRLEGYVEGSYGNYNMRRLQAVFNAPLSDTFRIRLGFDGQKRDGYIHNHSGVGPKDFNDVNYVAFRGSIVGDLTPDLENYTIFSYTRSHTNGGGPKLAQCDPSNTGALAGFYYPQACAQLTRQPFDKAHWYDIENGDPYAFNLLKQWQIINTTTWTASDTLTIKNIMSYAEVTQDQSGSLFGANFFDPLGGPGRFNFTSFNNVPGYHNLGQSTFTEELQFQGKSADDRLNWQAGLYFEKNDPVGGWQHTYAAALLACTDPLALQCSSPIDTAFGLSTPPFMIGSLQDQYSRYHFQDYGIYAQATYKLTDKLNLTGGIRYTHDRTIGEGMVRKLYFPTANNPQPFCYVSGVPAPTPDVCYVRDVEKSGKPTWLIDLDYKPNPDMLFYAKWARGYREGGVNTSNPGFEIWKPEKVDTYEVGAKTSFHGAVPGYFNVAAFYNNFTNQQLTAIGIDGIHNIAPIVNAGHSRIYGLEVDAAVTPFTSFKLDVSYAYLNTKLLSFTSPAPYLAANADVGSPLSLSPKNRVSVTGNYVLPLDESLGKVSFGATYTHTDSQFSASPSVSPLGHLPATDLLNLNFNWNSIAGGPVDLSVFATNVTNEKYWIYQAGGYTATGFESVIVGQPRMYGLRVRVKFGAN